MTVPRLWEQAISQAVAAVDWKVQPRTAERPWLAAYVRSRSIDGLPRKLAWAAIEVDKLVAYGGDGPHHSAAQIARQAMADAMIHEALNYDLVLALKNAYRSALATAVWVEIEDDPTGRADYFAEQHEGE